MASDSLPALSKKEILAWVGDAQVFDRGQRYFTSGAIFNTCRQGNAVRASCKGSTHRPYQLWLRFDTRGVAEASCSCPHDFTCKHLVALLLQWLVRPETFVDEPLPQVYPAQLPPGAPRSFAALVASALQAENDQRQEAARLLRQWTEALSQKDKGGHPPKIAYVLEGDYPGALSVTSLQGKDATALAILRDAAREARCSLFLVRASPSGLIEEWCAVDGPAVSFEDVSLQDEELYPPEALQREGLALVLWPKRYLFDVLHQGGLGAMLSYLRRLTVQWEETKEPAEGSLEWQEATQLARKLISVWPFAAKNPRSQGRLHSKEMLLLLQRLQSKPLLRSFISVTLTQVCYSGEENQALVEACEYLGWEEGILLIQGLVEKQRSIWPEACEALLALVSQKKFL